MNLLLTVNALKVGSKRGIEVIQRNVYYIPVSITHRGLKDTWCNFTSGMNACISYKPQCQYPHI